MGWERVERHRSGDRMRRDSQCVELARCLWATVENKKIWPGTYAHYVIAQVNIRHKRIL